MLLVLFSGSVNGTLQIRVGKNYDPFDPPHYGTNINPLCASLPLSGSLDKLAIQCSVPLSGNYLSFTVYSYDISITKLCDVILG